jgi:hypothetical protein
MRGRSLIKAPKTAAPAPEGPSVNGVFILGRHSRAVEAKSPWLSLFEECYDYSMPGKQSMFAQSPGQRKTDKLFDETAVVSVQEFASRLQAGIMPNWSRWSDLEGGTDIAPAELKDVNLKLDAVTETVFNILAGSNLSSEIAESFLDLAVGTGILDVDKTTDPLRPIRFSAIPLAQVNIDTGPDDSVDFISRPRCMPCIDVQRKYPKAKLSAEILKKIADYHKDPKAKPADVHLVEAMYRNWDHPVEEWVFCVVDKAEGECIHEERENGLGSQRTIVFRWSKLAGEKWGRGPLLNALPAIKTCNLTVEMILENAEMQMAGIWHVEDDGVVNVDTIELVPGTLIPTAPGTKLQSLTPGGNFDVAQLVLSDMRQNIKRALYNDMLGNPDKTPMSATEVSTRMADLSRQIGSAFGRLQYELVEPLLRRVIKILRDMKIIALPEVNGRKIKIVLKSPLAQAQAHQDVSNVAGYIGSLGQLFGPQMVNVLVKSEEAAAYMGEKLLIPEKLLRSEKERKEILGMLQQAMSQQSPNPEAQPNGQAPGPAGA